MFTNIKLSTIREHPLAAIAVVLALVLMGIGIFLLAPPTWFGVATAYPTTIARSVFGVLIMAPATPIVWRAFRYDFGLFHLNARKNSKCFFWMSVTYMYLAVIRMLAIGVFPPIWLLYIGAAFTMAIIWMVNKWAG